MKDNKDTPKEKKEEKNAFKEFIHIFLLIMLVFAFRSTVIEPYRVPTVSMLPTLRIGDFFVLNKLKYGIKVPFSENGEKPIYLWKYASPKRGEVIVFKYPLDPATPYIKRIVGVPGDKLELIDKELYVNGKKETLGAINKEASEKIISELNKRMQSQELSLTKVQSGESTHIILKSNKQIKASNFRELIVPEGKYFVMGDNRDFSADSRFWGYVPEEHILGTATLVWLNIKIPVRLIGEKDDADSFEVDFSRIGTWIH